MNVLSILCILGCLSVFPGRARGVVVMKSTAVGRGQTCFKGDALEVIRYA